MRTARAKDIKQSPGVEMVQVMNSFKCDRYFLVQNEMVIADHESRRVVAVVSDGG